jgi:hypothetical protein
MFSTPHSNQPAAVPNLYSNPASQLEDKTYSITEMKIHIDNLASNIYPSAIEYLTDTSKPESRHLKLETL